MRSSVGTNELRAESHRQEVTDRLQVQSEIRRVNVGEKVWMEMCPVTNNTNNTEQI